VAEEKREPLYMAAAMRRHLSELGLS